MKTDQINFEFQCRITTFGFGNYKTVLSFQNLIWLCDNFPPLSLLKFRLKYHIFKTSDFDTPPIWPFVFTWVIKCGSECIQFHM